MLLSRLLLDTPVNGYIFSSRRIGQVCRPLLETEKGLGMKVVKTVVCVVCCAALCSASIEAGEPPAPLQPEVALSIQHDVSPALRDMPHTPLEAGAIYEIPLGRRPFS